MASDVSGSGSGNWCYEVYPANATLYSYLDDNNMEGMLVAGYFRKMDDVDDQLYFFIMKSRQKQFLNHKQKTMESLHQKDIDSPDSKKALEEYLSNEQDRTAEYFKARANFWYLKTTELTTEIERLKDILYGSGRILKKEPTKLRWYSLDTVREAFIAGQGEPSGDFKSWLDEYNPPSIKID